MGRLELTCPPEPSRTGAFTLRWAGPEAATYRVTENQQLLYQGPALATTVSGRPEGTYDYSVEVVGSPGADSCVARVQPPSVTAAMVLFLVGLGVFLGLLTVIIRGHRASRREATR